MTSTKRKIGSSNTSPATAKKQTKMMTNYVEEFLQSLADSQEINPAGKTEITNFIRHLKDKLDDANSKLSYCDLALHAKDQAIYATNLALQHAEQRLKSILSPDEREHRRSIVIGNLKESTKSNQSDIIMDDENLVKQLIDGIGVYAIPTSSYRMGKFNEKKPRLMKVHLKTSAQADAIIFKAKKVNDSDIFREMKLSIRKSMSDEERKAADDLFNKQRERILQLKKVNNNVKYVIYARKICISTEDGSKPLPITDEINDALSAPLSGSNAEPMDSSRFSSS